MVQRAAYDRPVPGRDFDAVYVGNPPWDIGRPQPAFARLAESGALGGRILDVGCGTGEHALMAAALGLEATGIDSSPRAIGLAEEKARSRGLTARFVVGDALNLGAVGTRFDWILDSGLFHVFGDDERPAYVRSLRTAIADGGRYCVLCFSDLVPGDIGPRRVRQDEIRASFAGGWSVLSIEPATMDVTLTPTGIPAWFATIAPA